MQRRLEDVEEQPQRVARARLAAKVRTTCRACGGSGLSAPAGAVLSSGGVFVSLPASPVHAGEEFSVYMYAHTAGLSLNTWRVRLYFGSSVVSYLSFEQSSHFNSASPNPSAGEVSWLATGLKSTASEAQVTGSAIYLARVTMRVRSGVAGGSYGGANNLEQHPFSLLL